VDGQCDNLVTVIGHQCITLTIDICVQYSGREAPRRAGLSAAVETCEVHILLTFLFGNNAFWYIVLEFWRLSMAYIVT